MTGLNPKQILRGILSLLGGMKITFGYLVRPSTVVTQQYPENRETLKLADRTRALLTFTYDDKGFHKCTSCHICEDNCPNASIRVVDREKPAVSKTELGHFIWRLDTCTFCNLCVMVCPFQVLKMTSQFESSVCDQRLLIYNLNAYSGPAAGALAKLPDDEARKAALEARSIYDGPTALEGFELAGVPKDLYQNPPRAKTSPGGLS